MNKSIEFRVGGDPQPKGSYFGWIRGFPQKRWKQSAIANAIKKLVAMMYKVEHPVIDIMPINKKLKPWEAKVGNAALAAMSAQPEPFKGACRVYICFYLKRPHSHYGKQDKKPYIKEMFRRMHCTKAPDIDKLTRAIFDPMNKVVFEDDSQVIEVCARKLWGKHAGTWVKVEELREAPQSLPEMNQLAFNFDGEK